MLTELHECEARLADVMRAGDLEHARMAALIEACEAVADFIEGYTPSSPLAYFSPTVYANLRVVGKNARAAVNACRVQAGAIMGELTTLRELRADVGRWREDGGDARDLHYILETLDEYDKAMKASKE